MSDPVVEHLVEVEGNQPPRRGHSWTWKGFLDTFLAVAAILAIIYAGQQAKAAKVAVIESTWNQLSAFMLDIDRSFLEYPELRPYFFDNVAVKRSDSNYDRVMAMADMLMDFFDSFEDEHVRTLPEMQDEEPYWKAWEKYFIDSFCNSPALRERYEEVKDWYTPNGPVAISYRKALAATLERKNENAPKSHMPNVPTSNSVSRDRNL